MKPVCLVVLFMIAAAPMGHAQTPPITSSGLNTQVSAPINLGSGATKYNVTGGTRPGGGGNLFHSFGDFSVPIDNVANFLNDSGLPTTNILSRVTGGNPSNILGTVQTEGFGTANLFLMNPTGIVFGPNASLNVGGDTHFTTADYLKLSDGVQFTALPSLQDGLLNIGPIAAFGFLDSPPTPISVEGSTLSVGEGQALSLVGGDISIGSRLNAPGGQMGIVSVASPGEVLAGTFDSAPNVNGESLTEMGAITLEQSTVDVSANAAGAVIIRGGALTMNNAIISADTVEAPNRPIAIDIKLDGKAFIMSDTNPALTARTTGVGDAGEVRIEAGTLETFSNLSFGVAMIDSHTTGSGKGGDISVKVDELDVSGNEFGVDFIIQTGTEGPGTGGDITITSRNSSVQFTSIDTGDSNLFGFGSAGNLSIIGERLILTSGSLVTDSFSGQGGDITLRATDIEIADNSLISAQSLLGDNAVLIEADHMVLRKESTILNATVFGQSDGVMITSSVVEFQDGGAITSQTFGDGHAGAIVLNASDRVSFTDNPTVSAPSGLFTSSFGDFGAGEMGNAGMVEITTPRLTMSGGARINTTTQSGGRGGDVSIIAAEKFSVNGGREFEVPNEFLGLGGTRASGVYTRTVGSMFCGGGPCGEAGNISITTGSLNLINGAVLDSGTTSTGKGGTITVNASDDISIAGTIDDGSPGGTFSRTTSTETAAGEGGTIALSAGDSFFLENGATISTSSSGPADAGNIQLTATDTILIDDATVTTEAVQASGGNIKLTAQDRIELKESTISSSVQGNAATAGGNISLDPEFIILQNSQILAKAVEGQGGNISLVATNAVLVDPFSLVDASSALGVSGSVDIQAPIQNLSGTLAPLPEDTVPVTALYGARCATGQGGHFSTFVDSKAGSLSPTPGRFLASPLLTPSAKTVAATPSSTPQSPVILTASLAPLLLGKTGDPTTACP